ncbi:hypothetical protein [Chitinophaga pinensis]|uniref:hypothetical protein n=1 Tax=Chitinophaga pinensis TaxID=79329 RepID=UPI0021BD03E6|nr:hypothetical protein [Chitinophaga pinensis]
MNQYHLYTVRDFALDEYFQEWVLRPDVKNTWYWENWQKEHPEKKDIIAAAITLVKSIQFRDYAMPPAEKEALWDNIWDSIAAESDNETTMPANVRRRFPWKYAAAAAILLLAGAFWFMRKQPAFAPVTASMATQTGQTNTSCCRTARKYGSTRPRNYNIHRKISVYVKYGWMEKHGSM